MVFDIFSKEKQKCRIFRNLLERDLQIKAGSQLIIVIRDTPGPNAYNVDPSILNQDPNKHFGFLDKSSRFRSASKGFLNGS